MVPKKKGKFWRRSERERSGAQTKGPKSWKNNSVFYVFSKELSVNAHNQLFYGRK